MACVGRAGCGPRDDDLRSPALERHILFLCSDGRHAGRLGFAHVISEFIRGGRVISGHSGQNLFASMVHLLHRNTRRYGGYIVHFGVAVLVIGILGTPFNREAEKEMGYGDKMSLGPTRSSASLTLRNTRELQQRVGHYQCSQGRRANWNDVSRAALL